MILTETLFPHLWEIDETAHRRVKQIITDFLEKNPAPNKATQQLAWVQHMNSLKAQAEEIVNAELISVVIFIDFAYNKSVIIKHKTPIKM